MSYVVNIKRLDKKKSYELSDFWNEGRGPLVKNIDWAKTEELQV